MRFLLSLFFLFLIPGAGLMCWEGLQLLIASHSILMPVLYGGGIGIVIYYLIIIRLPWISTFEHELTHALVALCFFRRVTSFSVTSKRGGMVSHKGSFGGTFGDTMITLAPYFLPTLTIITVIIRLFLPLQYLLYADLCIGFTLIYHLLSNFKELFANWTGRSFQNVKGESMQSDIKQSGYILSIVTITALSLYFYGIIFYMMIQGGKGFVTASLLMFQTSWTVAVAGYLRLKILIH